MRDQNKTKQQLIEELSKLRKQNAGLERLSNEQKLEDEKYRSLVESTDDSVYVVDKDLRYTFMNKQNLSRLGLPSNKVIGKAYEEFHTKEETAKFKKRINNVFRTCRSKTHEYRSERDGKYFLRTYSPIIGAGGKPKAVTVFSKDISDLKKAEEALKKEKDKAQKYLDIVGSIILALDVNGKVTLMNKKGCEILGYSKEETIGKDWFQTFLPERNREEVKGIFDRIITGDIKGLENVDGFSVINKSGKEISLFWCNSIITDENNNIIGTLSSGEDITKRKQAEEGLKKYHANLKRLSTQLIYAQEAERKRISQELHDEIGQALTAMKINLATIVSQFQSDIAPAMMERLAEAADLTDNLLDQIQNISLDLRPSILDDLGLVPTLRWYIKRFEKRTNIKTQFKTVNVKERLHHEIETSIYRIVQEALTNVVKYAEADLVNINLKGKKSGIELLIEDNGRGFDLEKVISSPPASHGIGLLGIQERIAMLKGTTQLLTQPKIGTKIIINIPREVRS